MTDLLPLLQACRQDLPGARERLFSAAYPELHRLARSRLRSGGRNTVLDTTALVHESFLRFLHGSPLNSGDQRAFFAYAAQVMRSVIVDTVRARQAERRGGDADRITLSSQVADELAAGDAPGVLRLHEALDTLARAEPRLAQVVEMRYFGGFTEAEVAQALALTERTVRRDWAKARLLLMALLAE